MSTPVEKAVSSPSIAERAHAYGMGTTVVNGNDVVSVYVAAKEAAERARRLSEPTFIECVTYKMKGHGVYDKGDYRPKEEVAKWLDRDPILTFKNRMLQQGLETDNEIGKMEMAVQQEIEAAVLFAMQSPVLPFEEMNQYVYAER
jgi:pyruvate dehydrogenase E1 component alpha subunit